MNVLYIVERFPTYSETFIHDEIVDHLEHGIDARVCVLGCRESSDFPLERCSAELWSRTHYLSMPSHGSLRDHIRLTTAGFLSVLRTRRVWQVLNALAAKSMTLRELMLGAVIARRFPDATIIHCHFGNIGRIGLVAAQLSPSRATLFVTFHAQDITQKWFLPLGRYYRVLFESAARLLPISDHWRSTLLAAGARPERTTTHHMGVILPEKVGGVSQTAAGSAFRIVQVGRMVDKKGHRVSVDALARLRLLRPEIAFTCDFIGSGPLESQLRQRTAEHGLGETIRFSGSMQHEAVLQALEAADLFLLPSVTGCDGDMEGIPVALMEAMARGVPVISTRHSGIPELVEDGVSGMLVEEQDVEGLYEAICQMVLQPDLRRRLGNRGRLRVGNAFNRKTLGEQLRRWYRDAAEAKG